MTTVGYGDVVPVTTSGRVVAAFLMVLGITLFGILTAGIAAYFVHDPQKGTTQGGDETDRLLARFDALEARLGSIEAKLDERGAEGEAGDGKG